MNPSLVSIWATDSIASAIVSNGPVSLPKNLRGFRNPAITGFRSNVARSRLRVQWSPDDDRRMERVLSTYWAASNRPESWALSRGYDTAMLAEFYPLQVLLLTVYGIVNHRACSVFG